MLGATAWSGDQFLNWGWRVPFFLSIILVGIGLWIRLGILETPVFQKLLNLNRIERAPIVEVIKKQRKEVFLSALLRMAFGQKTHLTAFSRGLLMMLTQEPAQSLSALDAPLAIEFASSMARWMDGDPGDVHPAALEMDEK
jgi:MFS family permease